MLYIQQLWEFRHFISGSVRREIQARYKNSVLGLTWIILPPLAQILIYTLIFSKLIGARLPGVDDSMGYSVYLCAGIISWSFFNEVITRNISIFLDNANLIKKLIFPRICLPAIVIATSLINFAVMLVLFFLFLIISGRLPDISVMALVPLIVLQSVLSLSIGMVVGVINVFFRDVGQLMYVVLQFWFWLTPIVYPLSILPESIRVIVALNPMTSITSGYHQVFVYHSWPDWGELLPTVFLALMMAVLALWVYRRNVAEIVDEL